VTDAMKASRQHMDEKAAHELVGGKCHGLAANTFFERDR
jgi:hypothetical protein